MSSLLPRLPFRFTALAPLFFALAAAGCATSHADRAAPTTTASATLDRTAKDESNAPADVRTALAVARRGLRACRADGGPEQLAATLRFEPSGHVDHVDVAPASGPVSACVRAKLADMSVMPFAGDPVTVRMRVAM